MEIYQHYLHKDRPVRDVPRPVKVLLMEPSSKRVLAVTGRSEAGSATP